MAGIINARLVEVAAHDCFELELGTQVPHHLGLLYASGLLVVERTGSKVTIKQIVKGEENTLLLHQQVGAPAEIHQAAIGCLHGQQYLDCEFPVLMERFRAGLASVH